MFKLKKLPIENNLETVKVLKQLLKSHKALAELRGFSEVVPNKNILINAAMINEAKNSSEIENIVTTHDEIYKSLTTNKTTSAAKEVNNYREALWHGYKLIKNKEYLSLNMIVEIQAILEGNQAGIRRQAGTTLKNDRTGEIIYTPPQKYNEVIELMTNLEKYINEDDGTDDLIKLAIIHYQFESIHPFYDGNGRTGRIVNVLYLTLKGLLDSPIVYLSKYINKHKSTYYKVFQDVRDNEDYESLIIFILKAIEETSVNTLLILKEIVNLINETKESLKSKLPKIYTQEIVEAIFYEFYTNIDHFMTKLNVSRRTASTYLIELENQGFLKSVMVGRNKVYVNTQLLNLIKKADF